MLHSGINIYRITGFIRKNTVAFIALTLAVVTSFIVPPDSEYIGYFDFKTLSCLFSTLAVVCALKNIRFFTYLARKIVAFTGNIRTAVLALCYITFIGSMVLANDMALITFLPLGYFVLSSTGKTKYTAFCFIMQNIAANLGGMLTPFGNPQNLYIFSYFNIPTAEFMKIMAPPFVVAVSLITIICLCLPREKIEINDDEVIVLPKARTVIYLILFVLAVSVVFRFVNYILGLLVIAICLFVMDKKALKSVDYGLLATFVCFFVFAGNMSRIELVRSFISSLLEIDTLTVSTLSCQFISNVPSAILLSRFTENYPALLVGVNIGGTGTLIASLASLITFSEYTAYFPGKKSVLRYLGLFSALNFGFLIILALFCKLVMGL